MSYSDSADCSSPMESALVEEKKLMFKNILFGSDMKELRPFVDHILSDEVPIVVSRRLLDLFTEEMDCLFRMKEPEFMRDAALYVLEKIQPRYDLFKVEAANLRPVLWELMECIPEKNNVSAELRPDLYYNADMLSVPWVAPLVLEAEAAESLVTQLGNIHMSDNTSKSNAERPGFS